MSSGVGGQAQRTRPVSHVVEVSDQELKHKKAKAETARKLWTPAVNAEGVFGRCAFLEIDDPWNAKTAIRLFRAAAKGG